MRAFDTSILVAHLRGDERVRSVFDPAVESLACSLVAWELWKGARSATAMRGVARLLRALHLDPLTSELAEFAGAVHRDLVAAGQPRTDFDTIIAAHAIWRNVPLVTLDGGFDGIPGLDVQHV
jgi:predicted nucleic acid-binding protein